MIIYEGPTPLDKIIRLIKEDGHYDGCNSFGFLSKSSFCDECNSGYDHNDGKHHPCNSKCFPSCYRKDCPDFTEVKRLLGPGWFFQPRSFCQLCQCKFFGENCYTFHLNRLGKPIPFICSTNKRCLACCKTSEVSGHLSPRCKRGTNSNSSLCRDR